MKNRTTFSDDQISCMARQCSSGDLPGDLAEVADLIGVDNAIKLAAHLGCGAVYLRRWSDSEDQWSAEIHRFVGVIGVYYTSKIVQMFNGNYINIPKCDALFRKFRNRIIAAEKETKTNATLAREHGLTLRHIKRITNSIKDDFQSDLF